VVKDPVTEDFYRFGEAERFIAEQFDGATPVEAVRGASADPLERAKPNPLLAKRTLRALLLGAVALPILFLGRMELKIRGQFNALPIRNADVRAEVEGIVQEIYVDEGDQVREGERIASLADRDLRTELRKTEAGIEQSKARLKMLEAGPTPEEIAVARAVVVKAQDHLTYARLRLARDKALFEQKLLSRKDFDDTQEQAATAENDLIEAKSKLNVLLRGTGPEEIEATKAEIAALETQRRFLEEQLRLLNVVSPISGIVATPSVQLKEMKHKLVRKSDLIAEVYDLKTVTAEIVVSEKDIGDVKVGQKVLLKARAAPNVTFRGTVTAIATAAQINPNSGSGQVASGTGSSSRANVTPKMILVTTEINNSARLLKPEMTGQAKILCGPRSIFQLLTRRLARTLKVEFWSWW